MEKVIKVYQERITVLMEENNALKRRIESLESSLKLKEAKSASDLSIDVSVAVFEDDESIAELYKDTLEAMGYKAVIFKDGSDVSFHILNGFKPEAIILDLKMPGIDGFTLLERWQKLSMLKKIPILVVSGFIGARKKDLELWQVPYLEKPFDPEKVAIFLNQHINVIKAGVLS